MAASAPQVSPYGTGISPITAADVARGGVQLNWPGFAATPADGARIGVCGGSAGFGPLPEAHDRYVERSPLTHLDNLSVPVLLLQGDDDKVVPPSQPAAVAEVLARKGIPHKYILFAGE